MYVIIVHNVTTLQCVNRIDSTTSFRDTSILSTEGVLVYYYFYFLPHLKVFVLYHFLFLFIIINFSSNVREHFFSSSIMIIHLFIFYLFH